MADFLIQNFKAKVKSSQPQQSLDQKKKETNPTDSFDP
jgi:hypothetical protein